MKGKPEKNEKNKKMSYEESIGLANFIREGGVDINDYDADHYKKQAHIHAKKDQLQDFYPEELYLADHVRHDFKAEGLDCIDPWTGDKVYCDDSNHW